MTILNANPYFEVNAANWTATGGTVARSTTRSHEGVASLLITPDGTSAATRAMSEQRPVTAGQRVTVSAWAFPAVTRSFNIQILWFNASHGFISSGSSPKTLTAGTWTQLQASFVAPAGAAFAGFQFEQTGTPPATSTVFIDEAILTVLGITVTPNGSYHSPGFDLVVSGLSAYSTVKVERIDRAGQYPDTAVRGLDGIAVVGDTSSASDFEAPIGRITDYRVTATVGTSSSVALSTGTKTLAYTTRGDAWLKSVSQPALSRRVIMTDWDDTTTPGRVLGEYEVLGRRNKVVITDVLGGREGNITLATYPWGASWESDCYWRDLQALVEHGGTLLLQSTGIDNTAEDDLYFEVKSVNRKRVGIVGGELVHLHEISYIEVDRPATSEESLGLNSWQNILDGFGTWGDVNGFYLNWLDVLNRPV